MDDKKIPSLEKKKELWALILGGSSGLGLATAKKLGKEGYNLLLVHRDRKSNMPEFTAQVKEILRGGVRCESFNNDATNPERQAELILLFSELLKEQKIKVLVHSIAKGNLKPMQNSNGPELSTQDFQLTINAMALSLYDWVKLLTKHNLFAKDTRVISYTSEGNTRVWDGYAAVSAAKVTLEAITRSIALEFATKGVKANCIQAGVTDTKSMRMIPNSAAMVELAIKRNPNARLTTPEDVADAAFLLTRDEAKWITGTIIKVDGGESLR